MVFIALKDNIRVSVKQINFNNKQNRGYIFFCIEDNCCGGKLCYVRETKKNRKYIKEAHFRHQKKVICNFENYCQNMNTLSEFHKKWTRDLVNPSYLFKPWFYIKNFREYFDITNKQNIDNMKKQLQEIINLFKDC
jgi:hypothetical protein